MVWNWFNVLWNWFNVLWNWFNVLWNWFNVLWNWFNFSEMLSSIMYFRFSFRSSIVYGLNEMLH